MGLKRDYGSEGKTFNAVPAYVVGISYAELPDGKPGIVLNLENVKGEVVSLIIPPKEEGAACIREALDKIAAAVPGIFD